MFSRDIHLFLDVNDEGGPEWNGPGVQVGPGHRAVGPAHDPRVVGVDAGEHGGRHHGVVQEAQLGLVVLSPTVQLAVLVSNRILFEPSSR